MRIGIDVRLIKQSGVGRYIKNLVEHLLTVDKTNSYFLFFRPEDISEFRSKFQSAKKEILPVKWHGIANQLQTPKILLKYNLDLMHFPYFDAPFLYPRKFVVTIHDLIIDHFPTGKASTLHPLFYLAKFTGYKLVMKKTVAKAARIIVPSRDTKDELEHHYQSSRGKVSVVYEGVGIIGRQISDQILKKIKVRAKNYFLYVGNAYPHKNLEYLISSFKEFILKTKNKKYLKLVLVGANDFFYKRLKKFILEQQISDDVIFTGYAEDSELTALYRNALSLIFPSKMEGFGLPILEALANNCPVLASNIPIFHEIAGDNIYYFNIEEKDALYKLMLKIYEGTFNLSWKTEKAKETTLKYSFKKMAEETLKIYENCSRL